MQRTPLVPWVFPLLTLAVLAALGLGGRSQLPPQLEYRYPEVTEAQAEQALRRLDRQESGGWLDAVYDPRLVPTPDDVGLSVVDTGTALVFPQIGNGNKPDRQHGRRLDRVLQRNGSWMGSTEFTPTPFQHDARFPTQLFPNVTGIFEDPECDCEEDKTVKVILNPAKLALTQGQNQPVAAEFFVGSALADANSSIQASDPNVAATSFSSTSGTSTSLSVTAATEVIADVDWNQGVAFRTTTPTVFGTGRNNEGQASAALTIDVWGTQLYWANPDGSVRVWWDRIREGVGQFNPFGSGPAVRGSLSDGGDSISHYFKLNVPGGLNPQDWEVEVTPKSVRSQTFVDSVIPFYDPFGSDNGPSKYINPPQVSVENGVLKVTFKSVQDFPEWGFSGSVATMPYEIVVRRKSDGLQVRNSSTVELFDDPFNL